jgi:site-specific DNA-methyltransferase (adenine-specific)
MSIRVINADMRVALRELAESGERFHSCVTDPPYHLTSIVKRFGKEGSAPAQFGTDGAYARASRGFMGKVWDGGDIAFQPETWRAVYDVLLPGAYLAAFGSPRNWHRMVCAIEDAGFEIRDQISHLHDGGLGGPVLWAFGSGFPKSHDVSKAIDKTAGAERTLTRPGAVKRDGYGDDWDTGPSDSRPRYDDPATPEAAQWAGWGTALKPAWEPIVVARKPLIGSVAANVLAHGTGALNIDASRIPTSAKDQAYIADRIGGFNNTRSIGGDGILGGGETMDRGAAYDASKGRWPANVILSYPEDEYALRSDVTAEQKRELFGWLHANT